MVEFGIGDIASFATAAATIALVFLLWRTIKQFEATVEVSRVQTEYRFRPWIGPHSSIKKISGSINDKCQFDIVIKNYGELPAEEVTVKSEMGSKMFSREDLKEEKLESFTLGPMLPNMEKHFWFFVEPDLLKKAQNGQEKLYSALYFEYKVSGEKNGYGMISEYTPSSSEFIHRDMWTDSPKMIKK